MNKLPIGIQTFREIHDIADYEGYWASLVYCYSARAGPVPAWRNPLRVERHPIRPWELARVIAAERHYNQAFRELYRDFPRELWDWPGSAGSSA